MRETQYTITKWADETFGKARSIKRAVERANEEMQELLQFVEGNYTTETIAANEIADVFIVLYRAASLLHVDIHTLIDAKMKVNRNRKWIPDGTGHGYHKKE